MRKISQALTFPWTGNASIKREGLLTNGKADGPAKRPPDYDALLHRRKGIAGSEFAGVGLQFAITILVFAFGGIWLDKKLGSSPWLLLLMVFGGAALGFWSMYRQLMGKRDGRTGKGERPGGSP